MRGGRLPKILMVGELIDRLVALSEINWWTSSVLG